jgi:hypothetical protein
LTEPLPEIEKKEWRDEAGTEKPPSLDAKGSTKRGARR